MNRKSQKFLYNCLYTEISLVQIEMGFYLVLQNARSLRIVIIRDC